MSAFQQTLQYICLFEAVIIIALAFVMASSGEVEGFGVGLIAIFYTIPLLLTGAFGPWDTPGGYLIQSIYGALPLALLGCVFAAGPQDDKSDDTPT